MNNEGNDPLISFVDTEEIKHIFFHSTIDKVSSFNLITNLVGIKSEFDSMEGGGNIAFNQQEEECVEKELVLHLNCPGGSVVSAFMIADTLKSLDCKTTCIVEGTVASAGILVMLACENRTMLPHSSIFIHDTIHSIESLSFNDIKTFHQEAKRVNNQLKQYYLENTKLTEKQVNSFFKTEKTIEYDEALALGFLTY